MSLLERCTQLVEQWRATPNAELEGSLGIISGSGFKSGVDYQHFNSLFTTFPSSSSGNWKIKSTEDHFVRFDFGDGIRGTYRGYSAPVFCVKQRLTKIDIECLNRHYNLRINLKTETPTNQEGALIPTWTRLFERWSFVYREAFKYDLSKVAQGETKEKACSNGFTFEVELELISWCVLPEEFDQQKSC